MAGGALSLVAPLEGVGGPPYRWNQRMAVEHGANVYFFYCDENGDLAYKKSTNRGRSWGAPVVIHVGTVAHHSVWFDRWTPGDTGTVIHIELIDDAAASENVEYYSLNVATDTLAGPIIIFDGLSASLGSAQASIAKARGGNLLCVFQLDTGIEIGTRRSIDAGASWDLVTDANEIAADYYILFPGNDADNQDMWLIYWDISANEISLKVFDDSIGLWSETSIATSMTEAALTTANPQFTGVVLANGHLLLAAWSIYDNVAADLKTWDINGAASIVAKANIVTDSDDCILIALALDANENVYATYAGKSDGSQTAGATLGLYRKKSIDGMTTWGIELPYYDDHLSIIEAMSGSLIASSSWPLTFWPDGDVGSAQDYAMVAYPRNVAPVVGTNSAVVRVA